MVPVIYDYVYLTKDGILVGIDDKYKYLDNNDNAICPIICDSLTSMQRILDKFVKMKNILY